MVKIFIDDCPVEVKQGAMILEAAEKAGIDIPHLCYHPAFPPEGSCRMCLVEIEGAPKLELACSTPVREGMKVYTRTGDVCEARKGVLEFLLAEHPPDCPVCEQAGECKLQDYYEEYGLFDSHFSEEKTHKEKKVHLGKNLLLDRERCILCTRCVRFLKNVTGGGELGIFQRGLKAEISLFPDVKINNNYSGNLAELCPVGAITDLDFRFQSRAWFLESKPSICPLCSRGCNITIDHHPGFTRFDVPRRVFRIQSRENHEVNGYWICDKGRYEYDYIDKARMKTALSDGQPIDASAALSRLTAMIKRLVYKNKTKRITILLNSYLSNEECYLIHRIFKQELNVAHIWLVDPADEQGDEYLLTPERTPNKRGAAEIGFEGRPAADIGWQDAELLIVFESPLPVPRLEQILSEVPESVTNLVFFSPRETQAGKSRNLVFPTAVIAEKTGSLTNVNGLVQPFLQALDPPGEARPEWLWLKLLGKEVGTDFSFYSRIHSPRDIFMSMKNKFSFFQDRK
jgi:NADH-quinone oxidoreductase subunit G